MGYEAVRQVPGDRQRHRTVSSTESTTDRYQEMVNGIALEVKGALLFSLIPVSMVGLITIARLPFEIVNGTEARPPIHSSLGSGMRSFETCT